MAKKNERTVSVQFTEAEAQLVRNAMNVINNPNRYADDDRKLARRIAKKMGDAMYGSNPFAPAYAKYREAFTLIELLIVVAIVAIVLAIALPGLSKARKVAQARACGLLARDNAITFAMYRNDHGDAVPMYPGDLAEPRDFDPLHQSDPQWRCAASKQYRRSNPVINFVVNQQLGDYLLLCSEYNPKGVGQQLNQVPRFVVWDSVRFHDGRYTRAWVDGHAELAR